MFIIELNGNFPYTFNDQRVQQLEICQCLQETSFGGHPGKIGKMHQIVMYLGYGARIIWGWIESKIVKTHETFNRVDEEKTSYFAAHQGTGFRLIAK